MTNWLASACPTWNPPEPQPDLVRVAPERVDRDVACEMVAHDRVAFTPFESGSAESRIDPYRVMNSQRSSSSYRSASSHTTYMHIAPTLDEQ
jgi:hypothetical protein